MSIESGPPGATADPKVLRRAFGAFATGVAILTVGGAVPHAMTVNSFTPVSLDPPLVLVCVDRSAVMHHALDTAPAFGVSVLAGHQENIARHFADRRRALGAEQFDVVDWLPGPLTGVPLIAGALAHFECEPWRRYDGGDHTIFLGSLLDLDRRTEEHALVFCHGRFSRLHPQTSEVTA